MHKSPRIRPSRQFYHPIGAKSLNAFKAGMADVGGDRIDRSVKSPTGTAATIFSAAPGRKNKKARNAGFHDIEM
jgi:hypothetical protein